jgi:hypothetical protein
MGMDSQTEPEVVRQFAAQLARHGLAGVAHVALDAFSPLGVFAGQLLWFAQPALGALIDPRAVAALAELLEEPGGMARLQQALERAGRGSGLEQADGWKA